MRAFGSVGVAATLLLLLSRLMSRSGMGDCWVC
jgi:hypothetical protein